MKVSVAGTETERGVDGIKLGWRSQQGQNHAGSCRFYSKCKRKTWGDFQEGCDLICFKFLKGHSGRWVILDWIIGYARTKAILEVSAVVTGSKGGGG